MSIAFEAGLRAAVAAHLVDLGETFALPWPTALQLAGLPVLQAVNFGGNGEPQLALFNGALVAMESPMGEGSRTWWPVIDAEGAVVPLAKIGAPELIRARAMERCRALAVALEHGGVVPASVRDPLTG